MSRHGKCAGCNTTFTSPWQYMTINVSPKPEHELRVCQSQGGGRKRPIKSCARKARDKHPVCCLCGDASRTYQPGQPCAGCMRQFEIGGEEIAARQERKKRAQGSGLQPLHVGRRFFRGKHWFELEDRDLDQRMSELFMEALQGAGARSSMTHPGEVRCHNIEQISPNERRSYDTAFHAVEVTEQQIEAVKAFQKGLYELLRAAEKAGARKGTSLLNALADGRLTASAWDDKTEELQGE